MADVVKTNRNIVLIAAGVLALGVIVGGYLLGDGLRRARMADRAVTMRGLAERNVTADLATWNINFGVQGTDLAGGPVRGRARHRDGARILPPRRLSGRRDHRRRRLGQFQLRR